MLRKAVLYRWEMLLGALVALLLAPLITGCSSPPEQPTSHAGINHAYALATITITNQPDAKASASQGTKLPAMTVEPESKGVTSASVKPVLSYYYGDRCRGCLLFEKQLGQQLRETYTIKKILAYDPDGLPYFVIGGRYYRGYTEREHFLRWLRSAQPQGAL